MTSVIVYLSSPRAFVKTVPQKDIAPRANSTCQKLLFKLTSKKVEETASPIVLHLEENKPLQLHNLTIETSQSMHKMGTCTTKLLYTHEQDMGFTCLTFQVSADAFDPDSKFTALGLNISLFDSETKEDIIPDSYRVSVTNDDFYSGIGGCMYRLWTKKSFPLNVELNICATYMEPEGKTRHFETPGRNKFSNYRLLVQKGEEI